MVQGQYTFLILNHPDPSGRQGRVLESQPNMEKQRSVFILHICGTSSQRTTGLLQPSKIIAVCHCLLLNLKNTHFSFFIVLLFYSQSNFLISFKCFFLCLTIRHDAFYILCDALEMCYGNNFALSQTGCIFYWQVKDTSSRGIVALRDHFAWVDVDMGCY